MLTRFRLAASLAVLATLAAPIAQAQQTPNAPATKGAAPGGPGGGGNGGGPGGGWGGPGGRGGPGGPGGNSVERLVQNEAVQAELNVTDKQKAQLKVLADKATKERAKITAAIPKLAAEATAAANLAAAEIAAANGIAIDPAAANNNGGGRGGRGGNNMERQMTRDAMSALQKDVDAAYLKVLDAKQKVRVKQIGLQQEGSRAFTSPNPEVVDKLGLTEEQLAEIGTINTAMRDAQRQSMQQLFASIAPPPAAATDPNANNGGNNGGGPGGRGGRPNMANLDPAVRAKFDKQMQENQARNTSDTMAAIGKVLSKAQRSKYKSMIGEPFDLAKLRGPGGPGGPGGPPATAAVKPTTPATDPAAAAAKPARKSLRDSRGGN